MEPFERRKNLDIMRGQLDLERSSFLPHWRDIADLTMPRRAKFYTSDVNRGDRRNQKIIDATATMAARTLRSGMMSGVTSPARPWFKLTTSDPDMASYGPVKNWLEIVDRRMSTAFLRSNLYNVLPIIYGDIGSFGTAAMSIEEDFNNVLHFSPFPLASFYISTNDKLRVDVFMREFRMTVRQIVSRFGANPSRPEKINWTNISSSVKSMYESGQREAWVEVTHAIYPNEMYRIGNPLSQYKKYASIYFERGMSTGGSSYLTGDDKGKLLSEKGYDFFPIMAPRWEVAGEDSYGTDCPGMMSLGDNKQLQVGEKMSAQAVEKMIKPPMIGPTSLRQQKASILPGDITYVDTREGMQGFRPAHEINFNISALEAKQDQVRMRIKRAYFEDLFLMLASSDRRQITAREIDERHEEKLLALGPVLEQLNQDLLDPLIDNAYAIMDAQGYIPPAPEEIAGQALKIEYVSIMAQAQKLISIGSVDRFSGFVGQLMKIAPEAKSKINTDKLVDVYGDYLSIPSGIIRSDEEVQEIRQAEQAAIQQQRQVEQAQAMVQGAKQLSDTSMEGDSALNRILDQANAGNLI